MKKSLSDVRVEMRDAMSSLRLIPEQGWHIQNDRIPYCTSDVIEQMNKRDAEMFSFELRGYLKRLELLKEAVDEAVGEDCRMGRD